MTFDIICQQISKLNLVLLFSSDKLKLCHGQKWIRFCFGSGALKHTFSFFIELLLCVYSTSRFYITLSWILPIKSKVKATWDFFTNVKSSRFCRYTAVMRSIWERNNFYYSLLRVVLPRNWLNPKSFHPFGSSFFNAEHFNMLKFLK